MIDADSVAELIATYEKHGWILRRVLLSGDAKISTPAEVPVVSSDIDAAWFSRPPKPGGVAWEIRYLGDIPYALLEKLDENAPDFEEKLAAVEARLRDAIVKKQEA